MYANKAVGLKAGVRLELHAPQLVQKVAVDRQHARERNCAERE